MSRRLPVILSLPETDSLLDAARAATNDARTPAKSLAAWRDFVMVQTGILAGPRVAELCSLRVQNVDLAGAVLSIIGGKGDKDRNVPIGKKLLVALREWIGDRQDGYLFPGPSGKRLTERAFQKRLAALAKAARINKRVHPHLLRHRFATSLLKKGVNLCVIQALLGHASVATTQIYAHADVEDMKNSVDLL